MFPLGVYIWTVSHILTDVMLIAGAFYKYGINRLNQSVDTKSIATFGTYKDKVWIKTLKMGTNYGPKVA